MAIEIKKKNKGLLHKKLKVPIGKKIPAKKLTKASKSKSKVLREEVQFAKNAKKFKHK